MPAQGAFVAGENEVEVDIRVGAFRSAGHASDQHHTTSVVNRCANVDQVREDGLMTEHDSSN
jgi:hypothetical protein